MSASNSKQLDIKALQKALGSMNVPNEKKMQLLQTMIAKMGGGKDMQAMLKNPMMVKALLEADLSNMSAAPQVRAPAQAKPARSTQEAQLDEDAKDKIRSKLQSIEDGTVLATAFNSKMLAFLEMLIQVFPEQAPLHTSRQFMDSIVNGKTKEKKLILKPFTRFRDGLKDCRGCFRERTETNEARLFAHKQDIDTLKELDLEKLWCEIEEEDKDLLWAKLNDLDQMIDMHELESFEDSVFKEMEKVAKAVLDKHLDDFIDAARNPGAAQTGQVGLALTSIFRELKANPILRAEVERMEAESGHGAGSGQEDLAALEEELRNL